MTNILTFNILLMIIEYLVRLSCVQMFDNIFFWHSNLCYLCAHGLFWIEGICIWVANQRVLMLGLSDAHSAFFRVLQICLKDMEKEFYLV